MKAKVLDYNIQEGKGLLLTDEGDRYSFLSTEWKNQEIHPSKNIRVDFVAEENSTATGLYIEDSDTMVSHTQGNVKGANSKFDVKGDSKLIAGLLALFLGGLGIHKFYIGCQTAGIIMLSIWFVGWFMAGLPSFVIIVIALIEGIIYLTKSNSEFENIYIKNEKCWF